MPPPPPSRPEIIQPLALKIISLFGFSLVCQVQFVQPGLLPRDLPDNYGTVETSPRITPEINQSSLLGRPVDSFLGAIFYHGTLRRRR